MVTFHLFHRLYISLLPEPCFSSLMIPESCNNFSSETAKIQCKQVINIYQVLATTHEKTGFETFAEILSKIAHVTSNALHEIHHRAQ